MIRIDRVVTRGGDSGETSLGDHSRVAKDDSRIEALGTLDEANAAIGLVRVYAAGAEDAALMRVQNDLFDLGADLAAPGTDPAQLRVTDGQVARLEAEIAEMNAELPPLNSFVLPGGAPGSGQAHLARTIVRRAERRVVTLARGQSVNPQVIRYLNRLSDYLFVVARRMSSESGDVMWAPGATQENDPPETE
jgi:cob(I)alamin adenosyltransferase